MLRNSRKKKKTQRRSKTKSTWKSYHRIHSFRMSSTLSFNFSSANCKQAHAENEADWKVEKKKTKETKRRRKRSWRKKNNMKTNAWMFQLNFIRRHFQLLDEKCLPLKRKCIKWKKRSSRNGIKKTSDEWAAKKKKKTNRDSNASFACNHSLNLHRNASQSAKRQREREKVLYNLS